MKLALDSIVLLTAPPPPNTHTSTQTQEQSKGVDLVFRGNENESHLSQHAVNP